MYARLAFRNAKRSAKDYLVYLLTLTLSVGLFYGFLSITSPYYNNSLPIQMNLEYFSDKMKVIVPLVAVSLVFLISYVNRYMIKRRKKEFALQIILGMEQRTTAYMFFIEMLMMGFIAMVLGIVLGTLLSQIVSIIVMASFEEVYNLHFSIYPDTALWTFLFFTMMFAVIGFLNIRVMRKQKIIDMLHDANKTENEYTIKDMLLRSLIITSFLALSILYICFYKLLPVWSTLSSSARSLTCLCILSTLFFLFLTMFFLIKTYKVKNDGSPIVVSLSISSLISGISLLSMTSLFEQMLRAGMLSGEIYSLIPPLQAAGMLLFSILSIFCCFSWIIVMVKNNSNNFKYKHLFLLGQITSKLKSNSKAMAVLTCILLCTLVMLGWLPTTTGQVEGYLKARSIYDVQIFSRYGDASSIDNLPKKGMDYSHIDTILNDGGYTITNSANVETYYLRDSDFNIRIKKDMPILAVSVSDYNALLRLSGHSQITLPYSGFGVAWSNTALHDAIAQFEEEHPTIQTGKYTLKKVPGADYQVNVGMGIYTSGMEAAYILPDAVCDTLTLATTYYAANTTIPLSYEFAVNVDNELRQWLNNTGVIPKDSGYIRLRTLQLNEGISNSLMLRLGGSYLCLVLIVICLTILSLQQLTDATEHKRRFWTISNLGLDQKQIHKYIRQQMAVWFGLPISVAFFGATAVLIYLTVKNYHIYIPYVTVNQVFTDILCAYGVFSVVLICYFAFTYDLFKRNIVK